jgi:hypothetical protein
MLILSASRRYFYCISSDLNIVLCSMYDLISAHSNCGNRGSTQHRCRYIRGNFPAGGQIVAVLFYIR